MSKQRWLHEGVFYGADGKCVGDYYNNDSGWFVRIHTSQVLCEAKSRRDAIRLIETAERVAAEPAPPATTPESHISSPTPCAGCLPADGDYGDGPPPMVLGRHVEGCNGTATTERKET